MPNYMPLQTTYDPFNPPSQTVYDSLYGQPHTMPSYLSSQTTHEQSHDLKSSTKAKPHTMTLSEYMSQSENNTNDTKPGTPELSVDEFTQLTSAQKQDNHEATDHIPQLQDSSPPMFHHKFYTELAPVNTAELLQQQEPIIERTNTSSFYNIQAKGFDGYLAPCAKLHAGAWPVADDRLTDWIEDECDAEMEEIYEVSGQRGPSFSPCTPSATPPSESDSLPLSAVAQRKPTPHVSTPADMSDEERDDITHDEGERVNNDDIEECIDSDEEVQVVDDREAQQSDNELGADNFEMSQRDRRATCLSNTHSIRRPFPVWAENLGP